MITEENYHTLKPEYQFQFSSFERGPPRKMASTLIQVLAHYFWGGGFRRAICKIYTEIFIFKMICFHLHQQCPPGSASPHKPPALAIGFSASLTLTLYQITREIFFPSYIYSPRRSTTTNASALNNWTRILHWSLLNIKIGTKQKSSTISILLETAFLVKHKL